MSIETYKNRKLLTKTDRTARGDAIRGVNHAVYTLFVTPKHDTLHRDVASMVHKEPQPTQPSLPQTIREVASVLDRTADLSKIEKLPHKELTALGGVLIQFTDYVPRLQPYAQTPYGHIENLYSEITSEASHKKHPLSFANQLEVALQQTEGNIPQSLWRLFMTSRLHARWLDGASMSGMPDYHRNEKINRMITWHRSVAACKPFTYGEPQDSGGDTYYTWTHALAAVAYDQLPQRPNTRTRSAKKIFERGTDIMHTVVHSVNPQTVINDHSIAASYGNAIGKVCSKALSKK